MLFCFPSECLIKSLINPRNVTKLHSTFGTWMKDTAQLNDERIWVAEHFSGMLVSSEKKKKEIEYFLYFNPDQDFLCPACEKDYRSSHSYFLSSYQ